jgi:hypothetical protein
VDRCNMLTRRYVPEWLDVWRCESWANVVQETLRVWNGRCRMIWKDIYRNSTFQPHDPTYWIYCFICVQRIILAHSIIPERCLMNCANPKKRLILVWRGLDRRFINTKM